MDVKILLTVYINYNIIKTMTWYFNNIIFFQNIYVFDYKLHHWLKLFMFFFTTHLQDGDSFPESIHLLSKRLSSVLSKNVPKKKKYIHIITYILTILHFCMHFKFRAKPSICYVLISQWWVIFFLVIILLHHVKLIIL